MRLRDESLFHLSTKSEIGILEREANSGITLLYTRFYRDDRCRNPGYHVI
jgi:hypothetical protein